MQLQLKQRPRQRQRLQSARQQRRRRRCTCGGSGGAQQLGGHRASPLSHSLMGVNRHHGRAGSPGRPAGRPEGRGAAGSLHKSCRGHGEWQCELAT